MKNELPVSFLLRRLDVLIHIEEVIWAIAFHSSFTTIFGDAATTPFHRQTH